MTYKTIAGLIPTIQAASLAGANLEMAKKKKKKATDLLEMGATNVVGVSMIKINADLIAGL